MRSSARRSGSPRAEFRVLPARGGSLVLGDDVVVEGRRSPMSQRLPSPPPKPSSLDYEVTPEQRRAIERLADYPRRVERLRLLWAESQGETDLDGSLSSSKSSSHRAEPSAPRRRVCDRPAATRPGGLTQRQIRDLMSRDLTPEDYELLLMLDEGVKKAKTLSPEVAAALPRALGTAWIDEACGICLCALEEDEDVRMLPACGHCFHAPCAERWLTEKATCPLCGREETTQEKVMKAFRSFDSNGDGMFDLLEMKQVLATLGEDTWSSADIDKLFDSIDVNRDGKIMTEEFVNWVFADDGGQQQKLRDAMSI